MLQVKSFIVTGETSYRDGKKHKTIAAEVDRSINEFLKDLDATLIDIKPNVQLTDTQDKAFITIVLDIPDSKKAAPDQEPEAEVKSKKKYK